MSTGWQMNSRGAATTWQVVHVLVFYYALGHFRAFENHPNVTLHSSREPVDFFRR